MFGTDAGSRSVLLIERKDKDGNIVTEVHELKIRSVDIEHPYDRYNIFTGYSRYPSTWPQITIEGYLVGGETRVRKGGINEEKTVTTGPLAITDGEEVVIAELIEDE